MAGDDSNKKPLCKHCGSAKIVKNGRVVKNVTEGWAQRYRCQDCFRTFTK